MRQTKSLPAPRWSLVRRVLAGCRQSLLGDGPSRHYLCNPCVGAWTHTPPRLSSALAHSFLESTGLTPRKMRSAREIVPAMQTSTGSRISGLQSFVYLQAPTLARPPDCIHRSIFVLGGRAVYTTHRPGGYPFRDVASLRVRLGQLTRLDLHQLDCSLVGCSLPHPAPRQTASLRAVAYPLVQEARRWPPPSLQACLASSAIRCRDVETGPNLGVLAVFPSNGATCRCPLPSTGSRGLNSPASAVL